jgi:hypothetical protein
LSQAGISHVELEVVVGIRVGHVEETLAADGGLAPDGEIVGVVVGEIEELQTKLLVDLGNEGPGAGRGATVVPADGSLAAAGGLEALDALSDVVLLLPSRGFLAKSPD